MCAVCVVPDRPVSLPDPEFVGLNFKKWRCEQARLLNWMLENKWSNLTLNCPTGFGKSLLYIGYLVLADKRGVVLTTTKLLQDQILKDFGDQVVVIKGRSNYMCRLVKGKSCSDGPCIVGKKCEFVDGGCEYFDKLREAQAAQIVVTNYAFWFTGVELGDRDVVVCDEGHDLFGQMVNALTVSLSYDKAIEGEVARELESVGVSEVSMKAKAIRATLSKHNLDHKKLDLKLAKLERVDHSWVKEKVGKRLDIVPTKVAKYNQMIKREEVFGESVTKLVVTSATVSEAALEMLGIESTYIQMANTFPRKNRRLFIVPGARVSYRSSESELMLWLNAIRQTLNKLQGLKGVIHTISYSRRDLIMDNIDNDRLVTHNRSNVDVVVRRWRESESNAVLVSPVVMTGYDFPFEECRFQIVCKVPFPHTGTESAKRLAKENKGWSEYVAAVNLVQTCGRGIRSEADWCVNVIPDLNAQWFVKSKFLPGWFKQAVEFVKPFELGKVVEEIQG
jgi:Rad3-related DNA helicase